MDDSILLSLKTMLGLTDEYNAFDDELMIHINSALTVLYQLGVARQDKLFVIDGETTKWSDLFVDTEFIPLAKSYLYLKVRLLFDPPTSGVLHEAMERQIEELEWRLNVQAETPEFYVGLMDDVELPDDFDDDLDGWEGGDNL